MKKATFFLLALALVVSFGMVSSCAPEAKKEEAPKEQEEPKKNKDEESEFYDKDAVGAVLSPTTQTQA